MCYLKISRVYDMDDCQMGMIPQCLDRAGVIIGNVTMQ